MGWTKFSAGKYCASCEADGRGPLADYFVADRNGGIVMLFGGDTHEKDGLILSPFNNFMAMHNVYDDEAKQLYYGVQGGTKDRINFYTTVEYLCFCTFCKVSTGENFH